MEFNQKAKLYEEKAYVQRNLISWGLPKIKKISGEILELGSGTGFLTRQLLKDENTVIASDISIEMITLGKKLVPEANWQLLDAWNLETNKQYDWICSSSLLQWATDPLNTLKKWHKCLKNNGKVASFFFIAGTLHQLEDLSAIRWRDMSEWIEHFLNAGFKINQSSHKIMKYHYKNPRELLYYIQDTGMYKKNSVAHQKIRDWIKKNKDQKIEVHWHFCYIEAEKPKKDLTIF